MPRFRATAAGPVARLLAPVSPWVPNGNQRLCGPFRRFQKAGAEVSSVSFAVELAKVDNLGRTSRMAPEDGVHVLHCLDEAPEITN